MAENKLKIPRPEHPRPDFMRSTFANLNGQWQFAFDDEDCGIDEGWNNPEKNFPLEITVPFAYQTKMSGIGPTDDIHPVIWYRRKFTIPEDMQGKRILLKFGAVDYKCDVYINGALAGSHKGGYTPFQIDATALIKNVNCAENDVCLRVEDYPDCTQPRGKQYWDVGVYACWYTPVSGIWQTVYMESCGKYAINYVHVTPDIDKHMFTAEISLDHCPCRQLTIELEVTYKGQKVTTVRVPMADRITSVPVDMLTSSGWKSANIHFWSPNHPDLYDLRVTLYDGNKIEDTVFTYFGMRKIEGRNGKIYLNNEPLYQRLTLDQGYWPDSNITSPSDEAITVDLQYILDFGYNGARKHQKIEDPRYYYWADRMGVLVWGELPSPYTFTDETVSNLANTMMEFIDRDFNHPSIIAWTPLNESWGVPQIYTDQRQQSTARMLYQMTKAKDGTRLCSTNDGWEQVVGDMFAMHDYADTEEKISAHFADRKAVEEGCCDVRPSYAKGENPTGNEAFLLTEYGGIAFQNIGIQGKVGGMETWGYHDKVSDQETFFQRFEEVTNAVMKIPYCQGFCYTQLTNVMQEINGLLTPDRKPKMDVARVKEINTRK